MLIKRKRLLCFVLIGMFLVGCNQQIQQQTIIAITTEMETQSIISTVDIETTNIISTNEVIYDIDDNSYLQKGWMTEEKWIEERDQTVEEKNSESSVNENEYNQSMSLYKKVLLNEDTFYDSSANEDIFLSDFYQMFVSDLGMGLEDVLSIANFAIVDMDYDGIPEVIMSSPSGAGIYMILHYNKEKIYGYWSGARITGNIKVDGTYYWSGGASNHGIGKIVFSEEDFQTKKIAWFDWDEDLMTADIFICDKEVTQQELSAFFEMQNDKRDILWYKYTDDNIRNLLKP